MEDEDEKYDVESLSDPEYFVGEQHEYDDEDEP